MNKLSKLKDNLRKLGSAVVAFSGGVDSSFLLRVARDTMPKNSLLAVTAVSDTYTKSELSQAKRFARSLGVRHEIIFTDELKHANFRKNPVDRCYYCKKELFGRLKDVAGHNRIKNIIDASNKDDKKDYRPGTIAKHELGIKSPLQESEMTKNDIRRYSKRLGLETWDFPSMACLASRVPYGTEITKGVLEKIESAESVIKKAGFRQVRVRYYNDAARIEVEKKEIKKFLNCKSYDKILTKLKSLGFSYITMDLEGYRTGSLNEGIKNLAA
ncbi:MAG: ATP-dependent sacrificial sulfur transferase LarE [Candidatus Omnitrophica bacterium]|nr:ATP-dependent sacrificial sulfur transferase LarE [Candidatus Omnitrophota bacterium]